MANISLVTADRVNVVESVVQDTRVAAEAIEAGAAVRVDTTNGHFTNAKATDATEGRVWGIAVRSVSAGQPVTVIRLGRMDGFDFDSQDYDDDIYLADTDGVLADAAGTVKIVIGQVVVGQYNTLGNAHDKMLFVNCTNTPAYLAAAAALAAANA